MFKINQPLNFAPSNICDCLSISGSLAGHSRQAPRKLFAKGSLTPPAWRQPCSTPVNRERFYKHCFPREVLGFSARVKVWYFAVINEHVHCTDRRKFYSWNLSYRGLGWKSENGVWKSLIWAGWPWGQQQARPTHRCFPLTSGVANDFWISLRTHIHFTSLVL